MHIPCTLQTNKMALAALRLFAIGLIFLLAGSKRLAPGADFCWLERGPVEIEVVFELSVDFKEMFLVCF